MRSDSGIRNPRIMPVRKASQLGARELGTHAGLHLRQGFGLIQARVDARAQRPVETLPVQTRAGLGLPQVETRRRGDMGGIKVVRPQQVEHPCRQPTTFPTSRKRALLASARSPKLSAFHFLERPTCWNGARGTQTSAEMMRQNTQQVPAPFGNARRVNDSAF